MTITSLPRTERTNLIYFSLLRTDFPCLMQYGADRQTQTQRNQRQDGRGEPTYSVRPSAQSGV